MIRKISIETPLTAREREIMMALEREEKMGEEGSEFGGGSLLCLKLQARRRQNLLSSGSVDYEEETTLMLGQLSLTHSSSSLTAEKPTGRADTRIHSTLSSIPEKFNQQAQGRKAREWRGKSQERLGEEILHQEAFLNSLRSLVMDF